MSWCIGVGGQYGQFLYLWVIYPTSPRFFKSPDHWTADRTFSLGGTVKNFEVMLTDKTFCRQADCTIMAAAVQAGRGYFVYCVVTMANMMVDLENCSNRHQSISLELAFAHYVSHFPFIFPLSHSFLSLIFWYSSHLPPNFFSVSFLTFLHVHLPFSWSLRREGEPEWGQACVFQTAGHDTLVGREINLVGHEINLKGHGQNFFFNGLE